MGVLGGKNVKEPVAEVAMVEFLLFLCNRKDNNDAYIYVTGCIQQFLILFQLM